MHFYKKLINIISYILNFITSTWTHLLESIDRLLKIVSKIVCTSGWDNTKSSSNIWLGKPRFEPVDE